MHGRAVAERPRSPNVRICYFSARIVEARPVAGRPGAVATVAVTIPPAVPVLARGATLGTTVAVIDPLVATNAHSALRLSEKTAKPAGLRGRDQKTAIVWLMATSV